MPEYNNPMPTAPGRRHVGLLRCGRRRVAVLAKPSADVYAGTRAHRRDADTGRANLGHLDADDHAQPGRQKLYDLTVQGQPPIRRDDQQPAERRRSASQPVNTDWDAERERLLAAQRARLRSYSEQEEGLRQRLRNSAHRGSRRVEPRVLQSRPRPQ